MPARAARAKTFDVIKTVNELENRLEDITVPMDVSIIGCIVNGPGEAKESDFGLTGGTPANLVYLDGEPDHKVGNENLVDDLEDTDSRQGCGQRSSSWRQMPLILSLKNRL